MSTSVEHISSARALAERLGLTRLEFAVFAGISPPTAYKLLRDGHWPDRVAAQRSIIAFLKRAQSARTRADLRLGS